ncbi:MAG: LpqB family beta-propeller domain-containing protein [Arcanobacterium sp.]|nr:LpqB family beta-propeller domain-containing protein [Arcanobacterium sp.]
MRKLRLTALVLALALGLSACAGLPREGEVFVSERPDRARGSVSLSAQGPAEDATAEQIVQGFLRASSVGLSDDFSTARQFLTAEAAAKWNPLSIVRIYPDSQTLSTSQTPSGAFRVTVPALATVDSSGTYSASASDVTISNDFSLVRNADGQWRIALLDDGVTMSNALFDSLYAAAPLYFLMPDNEAFVADMRWYPRNGLLTRVVSGLVEGPSPWMLQAVHSAIPQGTDLIKAEVRQTDSVAQIDLSAEIAALSPSSLALMEAQIYRTVTSLGLAQEVEITSEGANFAPDDRMDIPGYPLVSSGLSFLKDGVPTTMRDGEPKPLLNRADVAELDLFGLAASYSGGSSFGAALGDNGTTMFYLDYANQKLVPAVQGKKLFAPSIDRYSWIWTGEAESTGEIQIYNVTSRDLVKLPQLDLTGSTIRELRVSREGGRAIVVSEEDGQIQISIFAITRDAQGRPTAFSELVNLGGRFVEISDFVWIGETRIAVLGRLQQASGSGVYLVDIGGPTTALPSVDGVVSIAGGRGRESLVVVDSDGTAYDYSSGIWRKFASDIFSPALPG